MIKAKAITQLFIELKGFVQGLGFRPFVYRLAQCYQQNGWVMNTSDGVTITITGKSTQQSYFLADLQNKLPPLAKIESLNIQTQPLQYFDGFQIKSSTILARNSAFVLPDISPCSDCVEELFNPQSRFYRYPFISCCFCGGRYSLMRQQPYDRIRTSMVEFTPCSQCNDEYCNPQNRRFHSQTIACEECGPQIRLLNHQGIELREALASTQQLLQHGYLIAIKAVGGFQLIADATNSVAVEQLRLKKQRPAKPLALLVKDLAMAKSLCQISEIEQQVLQSSARPIVLLKRLNNLAIAKAVAPNNHLLGLMLPASPLQYLLSHDFNRPLIATSGNRQGEPLCINDEQAFSRLQGIADYFLTHNREITQPLDDSIVRVIHHKPVLFRRARGYVPMPITVSKPMTASIAVGGQMKNTVAVSQDQQLIVSQHIGELTPLLSQQQFQQCLTGLPQFYGIIAKTIIHDVHPDYHSSVIAQQTSFKKKAIQHHHAHILACMAEHDLSAPVLGFAWDGTGLGLDNTLWGGEVLLMTDNHCQRAAHLRNFALIGGDKAAKEPRRIALALLYAVYGDDLLTNHPQILSVFSVQALQLLQQSLIKGINTPKTSSMGRLFDGVASLLDLCQINQFEGQAALLLEQVIAETQTELSYPFSLSDDLPIIIDWQPMIMALLLDLKSLDKGLISAKFHNTLTEIMVTIAKRMKQKTLVLSGGCFQNAYLTENAIKKLSQAGFSVYSHEKIPPNDGGLALGQLYF